MHGCLESAHSIVGLLAHIEIGEAVIPVVLRCFQAIGHSLATQAQSIGTENAQCIFVGIRRTSAEVLGT